ncbi:hypothetical protein CASFOL_022263 [Castilleja foliolosa]|uniref:Pentatricopeptide repeat-containing protein n=1 Tax=Castilleja foliolosa TaxID=1961234 RepID=A0ABD3CU22_9LAMI
MFRSLIKANQKGFLRMVIGERFPFITHNMSYHQLLDRYDNSLRNPFSEKFSTIGTQLEKMYSKGPTRWVLKEKLEKALKEHQVDDALEIYHDFKRLYGYPDQFLVANLISELSYKSDSKKCLRKACDLVTSISKEKPILLKPELMTKLTLSLSRAQIPVLASNVLRLMLEKKTLPSSNILQMIFLHLVKTEIGMYLSSNILDEIFQKLNAKKSANTELTKPDSTIFNLVLDACVRFEAPLKGHLTMELMALNEVIGDAHTAVIIARLHEMNCNRDELKKYEECIDMVPKPLIHHYCQFYDCLLSLHFKFNDIDSASALLRDLCKYGDSNYFLKVRGEQEKSCSISIGSGNIKMGLRLQFVPQQLNDFFYNVNRKQELLLYKNGKFVMSNKALAKLILCFKRSGKISELSKLLISFDKTLGSPENSDSSLCSDVIDACVYMGWLEAAHDILDDSESEKICRVRELSYLSLLSAYYNENMQREAKGLERQMRRIGLDVNFSKSEYEKTLNSDLVNSIVQNTKHNDKEVDFLVHEYNSSIYYFVKAKMIDDAIETYRKMRKMKIEPNTLTFFHLVCGYCSLETYREVAHLWGDIKRTGIVYDRDLYELLVLSFVRGGYFERVMEVIGFMMKNGMFLDKGSYRNEFLKFHRDLYRSLTVSDAKDETQSKRIEHVRAFRKLIGVV